MTVLLLLMKIYLVLTASILLLYVMRHYIFTLARVFLPFREAYLEWAGMAKPSVTVLVPMHNEERVCLGVLEALSRTSFDLDRLQVIPVNDRSTDRTGELADAFAKDHPWCQPFHRTRGIGGKAAALLDVMPLVKGEVILLFDADYLPGVGLVDNLVAPFGDPEIGAVMGRVVPQNGAKNLLTRLLDLERSGGYQTNQKQHNPPMQPLNPMPHRVHTRRHGENLHRDHPSTRPIRHQGAYGSRSGGARILRLVHTRIRVIHAAHLG